MSKHLLSILLALFSIYSYGQEIVADSVSLESVLNSIEQQTDFQLYYQQEWITDLHIPVEQSEYTTLEDMDEILKGTTLTYYVVGEKLILLNNTRVTDELRVFQSALLGNSTDDGFTPQLPYEDDNLIVLGNIKLYEKDGRSRITGRINFLENEEPISGAIIYSEEYDIGAQSDENGYYSIELPNGPNRLVFQSVNTVNAEVDVLVYSDDQLDIELNMDVITLNAIEIFADADKNIAQSEMGVLSISSKQIEIVPALLGEPDPVRVATLTAGVQNVGEGAAGINIRGGKADQNLFLLDGSTVYNTNHFFGFFSIFNGRSIEQMDLYKSSLPAEYGGRLSSVFDITTKTSENEKLSLEGAISPVTSNLSLNGTFADQRGSFLLSGRSTYSDYIFDLIENSTLAESRARFSDVLANTSFQINDKNRIKVTGYYSYDFFKLASDTLIAFRDYSYQNILGSLTWERRITRDLTAELQLGHTDYNYSSRFDFLPTQAFDVDFFIKENRTSLRFRHFINDFLSLKYGGELRYYRVNPGNRQPIGDRSTITPFSLPHEQGYELSSYFSSSISPSDRWLFDLGLRYSLYTALGPATINNYESEQPRNSESLLGTTIISDNEKIVSYHGAEPRLSVRYSINSTSSIKASYNRSRQYVQLLINAASISPTDIWRLSGEHIRPQIGDQYSIGFYKNLQLDNLVELSAELYYKDIDNLLDFKTGADLQFNPNVEQDILQGPGRNYGMELSIQKPRGWLNGWLNYTYSRSEIRLDSPFPENRINNGEYYPTGWDRPHYVNGVVNYKFSNRMTATMSSVFATGVPLTLPAGKWFYQGAENILYTERNGFRIPNYFRLDLGININPSYKLKKFVHSSWTFSVYNILGRNNVYSIFYVVEEGEVNGYKLTVFDTPIPTVTYNFKF